MHLYKIIFEHLGSKDSERGIKEYYLANTEKEVLEYIDKKYTFNNWTESIEDDVEAEFYNPDGQTFDEKFQTLPFEEYLLRNKGDIGKEESDYYYGVTQFGWELVQLNVSEEDVTVLTRLGIINLNI